MEHLPHRLIAVVALAIAWPVGAHATDMPVKAPHGAAVATSSSGLYLWVDGSHQVINLPVYDLGWRQIVGSTNVAAQSFEPRLNGYGISGAVGYRWPSASAFRVEFGGSYVKADRTQSSAVPTVGAFVYGLIYLSGRGGDNFACGVCTLNATLSSSYHAWTVHATAAHDLRFGAVTFSPSLAVFGGRSDVDQSLTQQLNVPIVGVSETYRATSALAWRDWGARLGLRSDIELTDWLGLELGGSVGAARRSTSLSANDIDSGTTSAFNGATAVSASKSATPFLANAEASATIKPIRGAAIKAFAGLNYDSRVPGISAPGFTGTPGGVATIGTPADILFKSRTSYYAGGSMTVKFAP
jgi:hypothetical protein